MGKIDAMWFFQKMSLGLMVVNTIGIALADSKITVSELIQIVQPLVQTVAPDVKLSPNDISFEERADGSVAIVLSPYLVDKMAFKM
jgi:hypothetical protein